MPHLVLQPKTIHATSKNLVVKIRGIAYSTRVSPASVNRLIDASRGVLKGTEVETFIYSDVARGEESGKSPGFGATIVAETKGGWPISAEGIATAGVTPEDLGTQVAAKLLHELSLGGTVGRNQVSLALVLMVLGKEDVGRISLGKGVIDAKVVRLLRYIKKFWNLEVVLREDGESEVMCTVKGSGFVSSSKKVA
ncbi:Rcl1p [Sugiyamaella lignohabitans]|uniref:Rcl1p n=1 Tax=Sugiyamaella lignohabitans TaxID=796027 RepID=A0A167F8S8_9ASCO|nr:Rcl1p [Sugiyamaella lignohabitans]ANB14968.1 Rcl1p [Sugiyamaella lignohabitans]